MSKSALAVTAVILSLLIVVVLFAGLDDLPRGVRTQIAAEQQALTDTQQKIRLARGQVASDLAAEPALFRARAMDASLTARLDKADTTLSSAGQDVTALLALAKKNSRSDRAKAEQLLRHSQAVRESALNDANAARAEADRWVGLKRNLPQTLAEMERDYNVLHSADLAPVAAVVEKAAADWPAKKPDLEARLAALRSIPSTGESLWQSTAPMRAQAAAGKVDTIDFPALIDASQSLDAGAASFPAKAAELKAQTGQLYVSWDKILEDLDENRNDCREKLRVVRTRIVDVAAQKNDVTSEQQWTTVSRPACNAVRDNVGMAIEHKSAGLFDSEVQRVAQPAGFAYMAPPSQGSNQYGHWENRGGGSFWVWYGQYALMRDLLFRNDYRQIDTREYSNYRDYQVRGRTYYGRDESIGAPRYGTTGTITQKRYADSGYARKREGFGASKYSTPASRDRTGVFGPRRPWSDHKFGRSTSRPSFGSGFGRSFGGGGRRFGRR